MSTPTTEPNAGPIVVVGDLLLDLDLVGTSVRMSPEAPVPVLHDLTEHARPGGAALAAVLAARGTRPVVLIAPLANDEAGGRIRNMLAGRVELVPLRWSGRTPVKTRLRAGDHPVARLDTGGDPGEIGPLPARAVEALAAAAAVLVSDYGIGVTADERVRARIAEAAGRVAVVWDPHPRGARPVPGTVLLIPNERELLDFHDRAGNLRAAFSGAAAGGLDVAARAMRQRWRTAAVCVTLGSRGALLCTALDDPADGSVDRSADGAERAPRITAGTPVAGADTCGAGDSFAAAAAGALADGAPVDLAVAEAVATAGRFVAAGGAAGFDPTGAGPAGSAVLADDRTTQRSGPDGVVVATGGCFDLLHVGHVATLQAARAMGDRLVVCVNSDDSVRRLKGPQRPLLSAEERVRVLSALGCVDAVVVFDEDTPARALRSIRPDIWVKGGDYSGRTLPEVAVLAEWGGRVATVPYLSGISTTGLVARAAGSVRGVGPPVTRR